MVQVLDLLAGNLEQPVSRMIGTICQSPCNTDHRLGHASEIYILGGYISWILMNYGEPGKNLNRQTALLWNCPPNQEFLFFQNYVWSGICLVPDPQAGLSLKGFVQGLHLASLYPERLIVG